MYVNMFKQVSVLVVDTVAVAVAVVFGVFAAVMIDAAVAHLLKLVDMDA